MRRTRTKKTGFSPEFEKRMEKVLLDVCRKEFQKVCKKYGITSIGVSGMSLDNPYDLAKIIATIMAGEKGRKNPNKQTISIRKRGTKCHS